MENKPREFWLDIATPYGDPCDFISEGKPNEHPAATNIHVIEKSAYREIKQELHQVKSSAIYKKHVADARETKLRAVIAGLIEAANQAKHTLKNLYDRDNMGLSNMTIDQFINPAVKAAEQVLLELDKGEKSENKT